MTDANELYNHGIQVMGILQMVTEYDLLEILSKPTEKDFLTPSIRELKDGKN